MTARGMQGAVSAADTTGPDGSGAPRVAVESPHLPESQALIAEGNAAMLDIYPPEEVFSLTPDELSAPNVTFLVCRDGGTAIGCVALVDELHYGVVKRLYVRHEARGRGVARALMAEIEAQARDIGLTRIRLETGPALRAAVALYAGIGYARCAAFGPYPDIPSNLFMEKRLA